MTGYGSAEGGGVKIEVRSLNHRFIEVSIRGSRTFYGLEPLFRQAIRERFGRGYFEIHINQVSDAAYNFKINDKLLAQVVSALSGMKEWYPLSGEVDLNCVLAFKEIFMTQEYALDEVGVMEVFNCALYELELMRRKEGENTVAALRQILGVIEELLINIKLDITNVTIKLRDRLSRRLTELLGDRGIDEGRLVMEAAVLADKADISEEIQRLSSHIQEFRRTLNNSGKLGRKLEFLLQEFNREANTISSKSSEYTISSAIVEMKNEIEKLREQVQNIQ